MRGVMRRRNFLQGSAATLAALGLNQLVLERQSLQYAKAIAADTPRKLALLVGINGYPQSRRFNNLRGCTTDVEMQRQLLMHRFKFHPSDIVTLSDESDLLPTRENILTAFEEHLIQQATPDSVVVFHFSGHGSRVLDSQPIHEDDLNSTFVPADAAGDVEQVDDIMGRTLFLLMSALDTEQVTAVLDSCYSGGGTRGNVRIRAAGGGRSFSASERELAYQEKWLSYLEARQGIDRTEFFKRREIGVAKGAVIAAAQRDQMSADVTFDGFDAGAFTYLMTQFLWQQTDSFQSTIARVRLDTQQLSRQLPLLDTQVNASEPVYFVPDAVQSTPAEAVVTAHAENGEATIWLGGIHPNVLATFNRGTALNVVTATDSPLVITGRNGLFASVSSDEAIPVDTLLREQTRVLPQDLTLVIGIDPPLATAATDIRTRVSNWPYIKAVLPNVEGLYGIEVHYILGKMTAEYRARLVQDEDEDFPEENAIGLFNQSLSASIPGSFGLSQEGLQSSLNKLLIKVRSLLAARFIRAVLNAESSQLTVQARITSLQSGDTIANVTTGRGNPVAESTIEMTHQLKTHEQFQISVTNHEAQPLYVSVIGVCPSGDLDILLPLNVSESAVLAPRQTQQIPDTAANFDLTLNASGYYETIVFASKTPFTRALKGLSAITQGTRLPNVADPNEDISGLNGLFEDFDTPRGERDRRVDLRLAVDEIANFSITLKAVEG